MIISSPFQSTAGSGELWMGYEEAGGGGVFDPSVSDVVRFSVRFSNTEAILAVVLYKKTRVFRSVYIPCSANTIALIVF